MSRYSFEFRKPHGAGADLFGQTLGRFYISFDDWAKYFTFVVICPHDGGVQKRQEKRSKWTTLGRGLQVSTALGETPTPSIEADAASGSAWAAAKGGSLASLAGFAAREGEVAEEEADWIIG